MPGETLWPSGLVEVDVVSEDQGDPAGKLGARLPLFGTPLFGNGTAGGFIVGFIVGLNVEPGPGKPPCGDCNCCHGFIGGG